jgi:hypothetical protein
MLNYALGHDLKLLPFFVFGFFCGIRPDGELEKLEWSSLHLVGKSEVEIPRVFQRPSAVGLSI